MSRTWYPHLFVLTLSLLASWIAPPAFARGRQIPPDQAAPFTLALLEYRPRVDDLQLVAAEASSGANLSQDPETSSSQPGDAAIAALNAQLGGKAIARVRWLHGRVEVGQPRAVESGLSYSRVFKGDAERMVNPIPWSSLQQVEVTTGAQVRSTMRGALIMGVIGAALGGGYMLIWDAEPGQVAAGAAAGGVVLGGLGAITGFGLGFASQKWETVYIHR